MPLRLRRAADQFPRARWEPNHDHLVIMAIRLWVPAPTGGTAFDRWFWSITCVLIIGWVKTREEVQQQFADAWRA